MAYVGNPIDTQNTFQSLVGKRFYGDGSTTAFTLDVAPSSTLYIEVFVGNVRQDPNAAYTLSGTTLTFTGAPPSGTNNIYVVHQAKSVGTIDVPASFLSDAQTFSGGLTSSGTTTISGALTASAGVTLSGTTPTLTIGDAGAEDTKIVFDGNAQDYHIGLDDSVDDLVIGKGSALGTTTHMSFDENGVITTPLQPMCMVVGQNDATQTISDTTLTTLVFDTENYDIGGNFNTSNYTFTAPVAGKYLCHLSVSFNAGELATNTRNFMGIYVGGSGVNQNFGSTTGSNDRFSMFQTVILDLAASNTLTGRVYVDQNGGTPDVWFNSSGIDFTYMWIAKIG